MTEQRNFISISKNYHDASTAAANAICRLTDYCEKAFNLNYVSATWLAAWLIHSLPKTVEEVPNTKEAVKKYAETIDNFVTPNSESNSLFSEETNN